MINFAIQVISFLRQSRIAPHAWDARRYRTRKSGLKFGGEQ